VIGRVAPVRDRRVPVDPHRRDGRVGEQVVEGEADRGAAVADIGAVLGPVRAVDQGDPRAEALAHGGEAPERLHGRVAGGAAHAGQADILAAEDEARDRHAGRRPARGEVGVVQHLAAVAAREEGGHLRVGRRGAVGAAGESGRRIAGDASAPGIGRLARAGHPGIGQGVAGRHVHHHERVEQHLEPAAHEVGHQPGEPGIRGRAAVGRAAIREERDDLGFGAGDPGDAPIRRQRALPPALHLRDHPAGPGAQVRAEPRRHHGDPPQVGAERLERVEGRDHVGGALELVPVGGLGPAETEIDRHKVRIEAELAGAGDEVDGADPAEQAVDRADHLEGELRDAVAERGERLVLEHHVGEAAIGRRDLRPLLGDDQRVGLLVGSAGMDPQGEAGLVDLLAVRPDPADAGDRALAQPDREVGVIGVAGRDGLLAAHALGGRGGAGHRGVGDLQRAPPRSGCRRSGPGRRRGGSGPPPSR
jgi:hypothetical protein